MEAARRLAEERHYAAGSCLFAALEADWTSTIRTAHRLGGVAGAGLGAHDPDEPLCDWELEAWTELSRSLGMGTAAMSLADHRLRQALEGDATCL